MSKILDPVIRYAEDGVPLSDLIAWYWARSVAKLSSQPGGFVETYTIDGRAPVTGEMFRNPDLARTFRTLGKEAGDAARWQHMGSSEPTDTLMTTGGYVELESGIPWETARALEQRGHDIRSGNGGFGGYQAILRDPESGIYRGASESRKDGQAAGY